MSVGRRLLLSIILVLALASACTGTPTPSASGQPDNTAMVLAEPVAPTSLDPLDGYAPDGAGAGCHTGGACGRPSVGTSDG